jgi:glucose-6-phosphate 1-epimerase
MWELTKIEIAGDGVRVVLATQNDEGARKWWPHEFQLEYRVTFGSTLELELTMKNLDSAPVRFEEALHLYHFVGDVGPVAVAGLNGVHYLDNMDGNKNKLQEGDLRFTRETDNAYMHTTAPLEIQEPALGRRVIIQKSGSHSTVTWNPWQESAAKLPDLGDAEWKEFAAVEVTNVIECAVEVAPGQSHSMGARLSIERL